ncbi:hypothetical protein FLONG3_3003 [Fusarium longipes]|uniref:Luciferase domain-containing protein n=1 Tax=Fusarium longipes TaxID=694270 RepID=A0A395T3L1_9HYPO|nr:hypothetical protein FLONG3_3003 [Fusarium longipes]
MLEQTIAQRPWTVVATSGAAALVAFTAWCIQDYRAYLALGPGGPPYNFIQNLFHNAARQHPSILEIKKSLYERHHDALFVAHDLIESQPESLPKTAVIARGELGHAHPDLSVHLYLSPADARVVIEKGWAERHRLSVPESSWVKNKYAIASTYVMFYGPRNEKEMEVLRVILESSIRFMTGRDRVETVQWREAV